MNVPGPMRHLIAVAGLLLLVSVLFSACAGGDAGLTRSEVEEIVRSEMAAAAPQAGGSPGMTPDDVEGIVNDSIAEMSPPEPGLTRAEVEEIVGAAIAGIAQTQPGLSADEAERIARAAIAAVPSKATPAEYTQHVVDNAIARYQAQGLDATLAHYNSPQSVDGQWYVFIIDENDMVIGHPEPERVGLDVKGWVGTDVNGYEFGTAMLAADEGGKWVSYVYRNPASGGPRHGRLRVQERVGGAPRRAAVRLRLVHRRRCVHGAARVRRGRQVPRPGFGGDHGVFRQSWQRPWRAWRRPSPTTTPRRPSTATGSRSSATRTARSRAHSDPSMIGGDVQDLFGTETFEAAEAGRLGGVGVAAGVSRHLRRPHLRRRLEPG